MAKDPYRYYRLESRELLDNLSAGVLALEKEEADAELRNRLMRHAHTFKGASRVVKQPGVADLAHAFEELLGPYRDEDGAVPQAAITAMLDVLDQMEGLLAMLGQVSESAPSPKPSPLQTPSAKALEQQVAAPLQTEQVPEARAAELRFETVRIDVPVLDELLAHAAEAALQTSALLSGQQISATLAQDAAEHAASEIANLREGLNRLRLVAARSIFTDLERVVRDTAMVLGKSVEFKATGGDTRVDGHVLLAAGEALGHMLRNAVDHGVEAAELRAKSGKPAIASLRLHVERRGRRVAFVCSDDGAGIDFERVKNRALDSGALAADASPDHETLLNLLFRGGISTREQADQVSGRGVGLNVVFATAAQLNGKVVVHSAIGDGTSVELLLPLSMSSFAGLITESGGEAVCLPLENIAHVMLCKPDDIAQTGHKQSVAYNGEALPFSHLEQLLDRAPADLSEQRVIVLVVESMSGRVAIGADRILDTADLIVRPLPELAGRMPMVAGLWLDTSGNPQPVLDPDGLVQMITSGRVSAAPTVLVKQLRLPILVIDDSPTTRMMEQSMLESHGYEVEVAESAEVALARAAERNYGLFIVDVEMPGMNGYEFVRQTRDDERLREVPAVMVTSLASDEDRAEGEAAGASAFFVKSDFEQSSFLSTVRRLLRT